MITKVFMSLLKMQDKGGEESGVVRRVGGM